MRVVIFVIAMALFSGGLPAKKKDLRKQSDFQFYVGTYTQKGSQGIYKYSLQKDGTLRRMGLAAKSDNPTFLAKSPDQKFLIAVNEIRTKDGGGMVEAFSIENNRLKLIDKKPSGGSQPCFVTLNKQGYVITANYGDGTLGLLKLETGKLSDLLDVQQHYGSGSTPRQKGPHAHSVWFGADNDDIISLDLGTNELWFSKIDSLKGKLLPMTPQKLIMPEGAGPRHMTFHPNSKWAYVTNELSSTITILRKTDKTHYEVGISVSTLPQGYTGDNSGAEIRISSDGKFLYASNRGHDSIVIYEVNADDGELKLIGFELTRGNTPKSFSLSPDERFLVVANQNSDNIASFKRNIDDGTLKFVSKIGAPTPVCILF
tara:strand:+ start:13818 stop:14933 length:1116 start_codon:yes stop_codon:yes gene_type:complete